jgi:thiol-disulfide isomerase/thioredoxin
VFLAHWCPHCRRELPKLVEWEKGGGVPAGVDVVGVATATDPAAPNYPPSEWLADAGWPWPVMADSDTSTAAQAMGLPSYPYFVLLKGDGTVALRLTGEVDTAELTQQIEAALA